MGSQAELFTCTLAWLPERRPWMVIASCNWPPTFVPAGMVTVTGAVVPLAPITSMGSVTVVGVPLVAGAVEVGVGISVTTAVAVLVESATLAAVMVTV